MLDRTWEILGWVFALNGEAFQTITTGVGGLTLALTVVFLAQLSLAIAQAIVLFINREFLWDGHLARATRRQALCPPDNYRI